MIDARARRLENEVNATISGALRVDVGGSVQIEVNGRSRVMRVDRIVRGDGGFPCEVWLSAPAVASLLHRTVDWLCGRKRQDVLRVLRIGGDVRRSSVTLEFYRRGVTQRGFREEICAPRLSRSVATFVVPRADAADWLQSYRGAGLSA